MTEAKKNHRFLGLDIGKKKVGIAISDKSLTVAKPLKTIPFTQLEGDLKKTLAENPDVKGLVIGLPVSKSGEAAEQMKEIGKELCKKLEIKIYYEDERLTSWEAREILKETGYSDKKVQELEDQVAAKLILQSFLNGFAASRET